MKLALAVICLIFALTACNLELGPEIDDLIVPARKGDFDAYGFNTLYSNDEAVKRIRLAAEQGNAEVGQRYHWAGFARGTADLLPNLSFDSSIDDEHSSNR